MPAGKEVQPECISQRASSGRLNCSCSRSRDLTAINPVVPEMMKIAALAVSTAPGGNMSFAFSKSVPIAPAKGRGKRTPAWTNRRAKALVPCGFADAKTAKGILQYQNSRKRLSNCPRIPREEVRKYGSFQSGAKYGIYRYDGSHYILFRQWKSNLTNEQKQHFLNNIYCGKVTKTMVSYYTKSILPDIAKISGIPCCKKLLVG